MVSQGEIPERNWYKVATVVLSIATVVLTFISVIYNRRVDRRNDDLRSIDAKIEELRDRFDAIRKIPKLDVRIITLKRSGLPESAFSSLSVFPAVVVIRHVEGETARGVTVRIDSESKIGGVQVNSPIENVSYEIDKDQKNLILQVAQLRRGTFVEVAIMQSALSDLKHETRLDVGEVVEDRAVVLSGEDPLSLSPKEEDDSLERLRREALWLRTRRFSWDSPDDIVPSELGKSYEVERAISYLETVKKGIEASSAIALGGSFELAMVVILLLLSPALFLFGVNSLDARFKRPFERALVSGDIKEGVSKSDVEKVVGRWARDREFIVKETNDTYEAWFYDLVSRPSIRRPSLGAMLLFSEGKLVRILRVTRMGTGRESGSTN